jgi:hypothetical protein
MSMVSKGVLVYMLPRLVLGGLPGGDFFQELLRFSRCHILCKCSGLVTVHELVRVQGWVRGSMLLPPQAIGQVNPKSLSWTKQFSNVSACIPAELSSLTQRF